MGYNAGQTNQKDYAIALGYNAGQTNQKDYAIALGQSAGESSQGDYAVALGYNAGNTNQPDNSIVLNASGTTLNGSTASSFYVKPIRSKGSETGFVALYYNQTTGEICHE